MWRERARAAILALKTPTEGMVEAGQRAMTVDDLQPTTDEIKSGWTAAIDAALGED